MKNLVFIQYVFFFLTFIVTENVAAQTPTKTVTYEAAATAQKQIQIDPLLDATDTSNEVILPINVSADGATITDANKIAFHFRLLNSPIATDNFSTAADQWKLILVPKNFEVIYNTQQDPDDATITLPEGLARSIDAGTEIQNTDFVNPVNDQIALVQSNRMGGGEGPMLFSSTNTPGFIGFKTTLGGKLYFGWIRVLIRLVHTDPMDESTPINSLTINYSGYGISREENNTIKAGQAINSLTFGTTSTPRAADGIYELRIGDATTDVPYTVTVDPANATEIENFSPVFSDPGTRVIDINEAESKIQAGAVGTKSLRFFSAYGEVQSNELSFEVLAPIIKVTGVEIQNVANISTPGGTVQLASKVTPEDATDQTVTWSITDGADVIKVDDTGLVTALNGKNGFAKVTIVSNEDNTIVDTKEITVTNQQVLPTSIVVKGTPNAGDNTITAKGGTLQVAVDVLPVDASNKSVSYSFDRATTDGYISATESTHASINALTGLVTSKNKFNGTVSVIATSVADNTIVSAPFSITISGQDVEVPMTSFDIVPVSFENQILVGSNITPNVGKIEKDKTGIELKVLTTSIMPTTANNTQVKWFLGTKAEYDVFIADPTNAPITESAKILVEKFDNGIYTAIGNLTGVTATVTAIAKLGDGSGNFAFQEVQIEVTGQNIPIPITSLDVQRKGLGPAEITTPGGSIELEKVLMFDQAVKLVSGADQIETVTWTLGDQINAVPGDPNAGIATLSFVDQDTKQKPIVTATNVYNGTVTLIATSTAVTKVEADGSGGVPIVTNFNIEVKNQDVVVPLNEISFTDPAPTITTPGGNVTLDITFDPVAASNKGLKWTIVKADGTTSNSNDVAQLATNGVLTAKNLGNGTATVRVVSDALSPTETDQSVIDKLTKTITVNISGQDNMIPLTGIRLNGSNAISIPAGTAQLDVQLVPANATSAGFDWSITQGQALATVDQNGLVKAADNGNGTIIVQAVSKTNPNIKGVLGISISNQTALVTEMKVVTNGKIESLTVGTFFDLKILFTPNNATDQNFTWNIKTPNTVKNVGGNTFQVIAAGEVIISAIPSDKSNIQEAESYVITVKENTVDPVDPGTGGGTDGGTGGGTDGGTGNPDGGSGQVTALDPSLNNTKVYPNPTDHFIYLESTKRSLNKEFFIFNHIGTVIEKGIVKEKNTINLSPFKSGLYFLKIKGDTRTYKFVKN